MKPREQLAAYLERISGSSVTLRPVGPDLLKGMPGFLAHGYVFHGWNWMNKTFVLAEVKAGENDPSPAQLVDHLQFLRDHFKAEVVVVFQSMDAYRRDRFTQLGIPFIVPGRQFFIPPFFSLMDRFHRVERPAKLSTPTQVVVLYQLLRNPAESTLLNQWAEWVGYSAMTLSNARGELVALGLCEAGPGEKPRGLRFLNHGRMLWDQVRPALGSPVRQVRWAILPAPGDELMQAGVTALTQSTMLGADPMPTYACRDAHWRRMLQSRTVKLAAHPDEASARIECWRYDPRILGAKGVVDKLSLHLSLIDDPDERVRLAANSLLEGMVW